MEIDESNTIQFLAVSKDVLLQRPYATRFVTKTTMIALSLASKSFAEETTTNKKRRTTTADNRNKTRALVGFYRRTKQENKDGGTQNTPNNGIK